MLTRADFIGTAGIPRGELNVGFGMFAVGGLGRWLGRLDAALEVKRSGWPVGPGAAAAAVHGPVKPTDRPETN
jgi:hypothetical protein